MRYLGLLLAAVALSYCTGCAGLDYKPYPNPEPCVGGKVGGIVYYDDSPYLIVWPDGKGNIQWQLQFLPDQTKKRIASPYNFLASLNASLNFNNGVLTQSNVAVDDTAVVKSLVTSAATIASAFLTEEHKPYFQHNATVWIFKMTIKKNANGVGYAEFANVNQTIVVPLQMTEASRGAGSVTDVQKEIAEATRKAVANTQPDHN
jgi:hypothetical protein